MHTCAYFQVRWNLGQGEVYLYIVMSSHHVPCEGSKNIRNISPWSCLPTRSSCLCSKYLHVIWHTWVRRPGRANIVTVFGQVLWGQHIGKKEPENCPGKNFTCMSEHTATSFSISVGSSPQRMAGTGLEHCYVSVIFWRATVKWYSRGPLPPVPCHLAVRASHGSTRKPGSRPCVLDLACRAARGPIIACGAGQRWHGGLWSQSQQAELSGGNTGSWAPIPKYRTGQRWHGPDLGVQRLSTTGLVSLGCSKLCCGQGQCKTSIKVQPAALSSL